MNAFEHYEELLSLTRLYLTKECSNEDWLICDDKATFNYFKEFAIKSRQTSPLPQMQQTIKAPVVVAPKIESKKNDTVSEKIVEKVNKIPPAPQVKDKVAAAPAPTAPTPTPPTKSEPFSLQLLPKTPTLETSEFRKILLEKFSQLQIVDTIPDDKEAKSKSNQWQNPPISVLIAAMAKNKEEQAFLDSVAMAMQVRNCSTKIIETSKLNELLSSTLKLIIADRQALASYPNLQKHYRWDPAQFRHFIGPIPLIILEDLNHYLKDPKQKRELWNSLRAILKI